MPFFVWNVNSPALYPILIIPAAFQTGILYPRHSRDCVAGRGNPSPIMRKHYRQFNVAAAKAAANWTAHLASSFSRLRESTLCGARICAKAQTAIYRRKWQTPAAAKAAGVRRRVPRRHSRPAGAGIQHSRESAPALSGNTTALWFCD